MYGWSACVCCKEGARKKVKASLKEEASCADDAKSLLYNYVLAMSRFALKRTLDVDCDDLDVDDMFTASFCSLDWESSTSISLHRRLELCGINMRLSDDPGIVDSSDVIKQLRKIFVAGKLIDYDVELRRDAHFMATTRYLATVTSADELWTLLFMLRATTLHEINAGALCGELTYGQCRMLRQPTLQLVGLLDEFGLHSYRCRQVKFTNGDCCCAADDASLLQRLRNMVAEGRDIEFVNDL